MRITGRFEGYFLSAHMVSHRMKVVSSLAVRSLASYSRPIKNRVRVKVRVRVSLIGLLYEAIRSQYFRDE